MTTLLLLDLPRVRQWTLNARSIMPLCLDGERHSEDTGQRGQQEASSCASGAPKSAMMPSPITWFTVPS